MGSRAPAGSAVWIDSDSSHDRWEFPSFTGHMAIFRGRA
jgi:hypothetical protein